MNVAWNFATEHFPIHRESRRYSPPKQASPHPPPSVSRPPSPQQDVQPHPISVRLFQRTVESLCGKILELTDGISGLDDVEQFIQKVLTRNLKQRRFTKRRPLRHSEYDKAMITVRSRLKELLTYLEKTPVGHLDHGTLDFYMRQIDEGCLAMAVLEGQTSSRRFRSFSRRTNMKHHKEKTRKFNL